MSSALPEQIAHAARIIQQGGIIAYPTEAVYGLGCDPFNSAAVEKLLALKQRPMSKGLIIIAAEWSQVKNLVAPIPQARLKAIFETWPGPATWVFPASEMAPACITGDFTSIALRITAHPIARQLCLAAGPIVSTSANIAQQPPATSAAQVKQIFSAQIDAIIDADVGKLGKPTIIRDALTAEVIRT
jgi:L-threonylcarbamoyladenylate synthase